MEFQRATFQLIGGVDTKLSGIGIGPPQLLRAENCFADKTGALRKRYGVTGMSALTVDNGTVNQAAALARYKGSLLALEVSATPNVLEYSPATDRWTEHGTYAPGVLLSQPIAAANGGGGIWAAECGVCGHYTLFATIEDGVDDLGTFNSTFRVTLQDGDGTFICHQLQIWTHGSGASVADKLNLRVAVLGTKFYVFFNDFPNTNLYVWILDTATPATITAAIGTSGGGSAASPSVVVANLDGSDLGTFDVAATVNGVFLAYRTTTANRITIGFVNASGVLGSTSNLATTGNATVIAVTFQSASRHAVCYVSDSTAGVYAVHLSWSGAAWSTTSTSGLIDTCNGLVLACGYDSATTLRIWYNDAPLYQATSTTAGVQASRVVTLQQAKLTSRPFTAGDGKRYFWAKVGTTKQRTHYLVESSTGLPMAVADRAVAVSGLLSSVSTLSDGGLITCLLYITRPVNGSLAVASGAVNVGARAATWRLDHPQAFQMAEVGESLYLAGALPQQFDGVSFVETGFLNFVDTSAIVMVKAAGGSMTASAQYFYAVIEERMNGRGMREFGTHNGVVSVTLGAGDHQVTLTVPTNVMTRQRRTNTVVSSAQIARSSSVFGIYRSDKNPLTSKAPLYRVGEVANNPTAATVAFVDQMADATAVLNEELYLVSGEVDHSPPPAGHIMCEGNGRVFVAGDPEHPLTVFFSLLRAPDEPVSFNDAFTIDLPSGGGDITVLAVLQESLIVFKERAIYRVPGAGPNNTLSDGGSFGDPELISNAVGCIGQRSMVVAPFGLMFQSARGIHLLDTGLTLEYIGVQLEALGDIDSRQTMGPNTVIVDSILLPQLQQVRFANGSVIWVFDYYRKLWTVYTDTSCYGPSALYQEAHVFPGVVSGLAGGVTVVAEDATKHFTAATYFVKALVRPAGSAQDDMRFRKVALTGEVFGQIGDLADIRMRFFANNSAVSAAQTSQSPHLPTSAPFRWQERTRKGARVVSALAIEITDVGLFGGVGPCSISVNEITLEMGPRQQGLSRRVG